MKTDSQEVYDYINQLIADSKLHPSEYGGSPESLEGMWFWLDHCKLFILGKNRRTKEYPLGFSMNGFVLENGKVGTMSFTHYIKHKEKTKKVENVYKRLLGWREKYENWFLGKMNGDFVLEKNSKQLSAEIKKTINYSKKRPLMYGGSPEGVLSMWGWLDKVSFFLLGLNYGSYSMESFCRAEYKLGMINLFVFLRQDEINSFTLSVPERKVFTDAQSKRLRNFRNRYEKWLKNQLSNQSLVIGVS